MKFILIFCVAIWMAVAASSDRVLLKSVSSFVVREGAMTNARRSAAVPQLLCTGGSSCSQGPRSALCKNVGFDGVDVTWKCEAEMTPGLRFDQVQVSCEGYGYADDPYILADSCGVEYTLQGTPQSKPAGPARKKDPSPFPPAMMEQIRKTAPLPTTTDNSSSMIGTIISFLGIFLLVIIVLGCLLFGSHPPRDNSSISRPTSSGGGGPGFWSGFGLGAITGYSMAPQKKTFQQPAIVPPRALMQKEKEEDDVSVAYSTTKRREETSVPKEKSLSVAHSTTKRREESTNSKAADDSPVTSTAYSATKRR